LCGDVLHTFSISLPVSEFELRRRYSAGSGIHDGIKHASCIEHSIRRTGDQFCVHDWQATNNRQQTAANIQLFFSVSGIDSTAPATTITS
jgi:hypothetical protein